MCTNRTWHSVARSKAGEKLGRRLAAFLTVQGMEINAAVHVALAVFLSIIDTFRTLQTLTVQDMSGFSHLTVNGSSLLRLPEDARALHALSYDAMVLSPSELIVKFLEANYVTEYGGQGVFAFRELIKDFFVREKSF